MTQFFRDTACKLERLGFPKYWQKYLLALEIQGVVALALIWVSYPMSRAAIPMHALMLVFLVAGLCLTLKLIRNLSLSYVIAAIMVATVVELTLILVYSLHYFGYKFLAAPIGFEMLLGYVKNFKPLIASVGLSSLWTGMSIALLLSIIFLLNFKLFRNQRDSHDSFWFVLILLAILASLYISTRHVWIPREPLHVLLYKPAPTYAPKGLFSFSEPRLIPRYELKDTVEKLKIDYRPMVLIVVDALRSDAMGVYGNSTENTPFLTSLVRSRKLVRVDDAKSICTFSYCGLVGLLSSRYWSQLNSTPDNLPDVLSTYGYRSYFLLGGDHTNFMGLRRQYGDNLHGYMDGSMESAEYANDDRLIDKWLNDFQPEDSVKSFLYIHLMSVHRIGMRQSNFNVEVRDPLIKDRRVINGAECGEYIQQYNNGILQADYHIKNIFSWLDSRGWLDDALVIITSDHGEYLGEFDKLGHGGPPYDPVINIPLLIYDGRSGHYPYRTITSQVDIGPTFLHAINAPIPIDWSGIPLQLTTERCAVAINSHDTEGLVGVVQGVKLKYLKKEEDRQMYPIVDMSRKEEDEQSPINDRLNFEKLKTCFNQR